MTTPMDDAQFEREIREFLAWQAADVAGAPTTTEMTARVGSHGGVLVVRHRPARMVAWVAIAALLAMAVVGGALLAGRSSTIDGPLPATVDEPPPTSYEAVFTRQIVVDGAPGMLVVAVDSTGRERELARLPIGEQHLTGTAAVALSGLLVKARAVGGNLAGYEIVDLHRPDAPPMAIADIEQDVEQFQGTPYYGSDPRPGVFWGPGDTVAIPWYVRNASPWHVGLIDGRTGTGPTVDIPDDQSLLPHWTANGSGIALGARFVDTPAAAVARTLGQDGTIVDGPVMLAPSTYSRHYRSDGAAVSVAGGGDLIVIDDPTTTTDYRLVPDADIEDVAWSARGDELWLVVRLGPDRRDVQIERLSPDGSRHLVVVIADDAPADAETSRQSGRIVGIAPDDTMIVLGLDRITGDRKNGGSSPVAAAELVTPGDKASMKIQGTFIGWMEVGS